MRSSTPCRCARAAARSGALTVTVTLALALASPARASEADDVMQKVDRAVSSVNDKIWIVQMRIIGTGGEVHEAKMLMLQHGNEKRVVRFLAPAQVRNTAIMALGATDLYVFMANEGRTRRLGSSALSQTFLGSDFTFEDLADTRYTDRYTPRIIGRRGEDHVVELSPKSGGATWSKLVLNVESHGLLSRIEYYDKQGRHARTQTRTFERANAQYESWVPKRLLMVNEQTKHATELLMQVADADRGIPADVFTLRGLQRGDDLRFAP